MPWTYLENFNNRGSELRAASEIDVEIKSKVTHLRNVRYRHEFLIDDIDLWSSSGVPGQQTCGWRCRDEEENDYGCYEDDQVLLFPVSSASSK